MKLSCICSSSFWSDVNSGVNRFSDDFMENSALPALKKAYAAAGKNVAYLAGKLKPEWQKKVEKSWEAPISIPTALKVTEKFKGVLERLIDRKPTELKGLHYLDACVISAAQSLYPFVKESAYLLALPQKLKDYAEYFNFDHSLDKFSKALGSFFWIGYKVVLLFKFVGLLLIEGIIRTVDFLFQRLLFNSHVQVLGYLKDVIIATRRGVKMRFVDMAHKAIDKRAEKLRISTTKSCVDYAVDYVGSIAGRLGFKTAAIASLFFCAPVPAIQLAGAAALSPVLWKEGIQPLLDPYYASYEPDFEYAPSYMQNFYEKFPAVGEYKFGLRLLRNLV